MMLNKFKHFLLCRSGLTRIEFNVFAAIAALIAITLIVNMVVYMSADITVVAQLTRDPLAGSL